MISSVRDPTTISVINFILKKHSILVVITGLRLVSW